MRARSLAAVLACLLWPALTAPAPAGDKRPLTLDDLFALKDVADPRVSPDGAWVAYTVTALDAARDRADTDVWMAPFAAEPGAPGEPVRLTTGDEPETRPRWSPDGRYLAFLSKRGGKKTQVWLLDRRGGEAVKLTDYRADVSDLAWSPDGKRLALAVADVDPDDPDFAEPPEGMDEPPPKPIVIRRRQFKRDGEGYLTEIRTHLHLFDLATRESVQVTDGPYDDASPVFSPDGGSIAFVSNRTDDPDANQNTDLFLVAVPEEPSEPSEGAEAREIAPPRPLTRSPGADSDPAFSPDGKLVAYLAGGDPAKMWYAMNSVAVVPAAGGEERRLTAALDRNAWAPRFSADGGHVLFLLEDRGSTHLARVPAAGGEVERLVAGEREIRAFDVGAGGGIAVLESRPNYPFEVFALESGEDGGLRRLTRVNDELLAGIELAPVTRFTATSRDGTPIDYFQVVPAGTEPGARLPTLLRIHGGPTAQYANEFAFDWQLFAARGYAVVGANPRGSSGYGEAFAYAIWADWGNKDYEDVMAAVDHAIARGVADPERLGVGGWSYGAMLTNYVIVKTDRFGAAISGSSEFNYLSNYGHDHYQLEWELELGLPWVETERWIRLSPFFQVEKIVTPTLVLCGQEDWNVPLLNSEQLYQALKRLGRDTELVIYPGENHGISRPSFQRDRLERYLAWYDRYLKKD